jgi:hypothetical protein
MLRRVAEREATQGSTRTLWHEGLVKSPLGVGVEVVAYQRYPLAVGITGVEHMCHLERLVHFRALRPRGGLPKPRKRFGKHKDAGGACALVFIVDACRMSLCRRNGGRVSRINCTGCSSMHSTGWVGS